MIKFLKKTIKSYWKRYHEYNKIANFAEIGRRYFVMNSFDGILTIIGILAGSYFAGIIEPRIIITTSIAAAVAMSVSGFWGTYLAEEAERKKALRDLEKVTLSKLKDTKIHRAGQVATYIVSFIDGISPFVASIIVILPFMFGGLFLLTINMMYTIAIGVAFILLVILGAFLGKISKESMLINAFKMVIAGVVSIGIILLLQVNHI